MIPTLILLGFVAGLLRRGWTFLAVAAVGWPLLLLAASVDTGFSFVAGAGLLAALNAALGALLGRGVRQLAALARA